MDVDTLDASAADSRPRARFGDERRNEAVYVTPVTSRMGLPLALLWWCSTPMWCAQHPRQRPPHVMRSSLRKFYPAALRVLC
jgi:hypothetical protein